MNEKKYKIQPSAMKGWWVYTTGPRGGWKAERHYRTQLAAAELAELLNRHHEEGEI